MASDINDTAALPAYVAIAPCGCTKMACVDEPKHAKDTAKEIAACIRYGWRIERVTVGWIREHWVGSCDICQPPKRKRNKKNNQEALPL